MSSETLELDGARLFTLTVGSGTETCVVVHGGPGASHDYLRPQLDRLAQGERRLVYYDQRGGGQSQGEGGVEEHLSDLGRMVQHFSATTLIGYSWGALLCSLFAARHPVDRLVLISPGPVSSGFRDAYKNNMAKNAARPEVAALKATLDPKNRQHRFALAVAGYFVDPKLALELTPFLVKQRAEQAVWKSLGEPYDLLPQLTAVKAPAFIVVGKQDPIPVDNARALAARLEAECLELDACGHVPYVEQPEALFAAVERFLAQKA